MSTNPDFTVFTVRSAVCNMRDGAAEILRANQQIAEFLLATETSPGVFDDDGQIYTVPIARAPDRPLPYCVLAVVRERRGKLLGSEVEIFGTIGITLFYDEQRETLSTTDRTAEDFFNCVYSALASDQNMNQQPLGAAAQTATGKGLADYMLETETQDFQYWESADPEAVTVERTCLFNWSTTANIQTGVPQ